MFKNCKLAKIEQDIGEHWNEQGVPPMGQLAYRTDSFLPAREGECWTQRDIGERLGVDHKTISNDLGKNCSFAKIPQDLGEHWNEQGVPKTERISVQFS
jgi:hypothetical protein